MGMKGEVHIDQANKSAVVYARGKTILMFGPGATRSTIDSLLEGEGWKRTSGWFVDADGHKAKVKEK